jgi:aminopeptidase N
MVSLTLLLFNRNHNSSTPDDLFAALQEAADDAGIFQNVNVTAIMESWTTQAGYPLITAHSTTDSIHITQVRQMPNITAFTKGTYNDYNRMT